MGEAPMSEQDLRNQSSRNTAAEIVARYTDQPSRMPAALRDRIEDLKAQWGLPSGAKGDKR